MQSTRTCRRVTLPRAHAFARALYETGTDSRDNVRATRHATHAMRRAAHLHVPCNYWRQNDQAIGRDGTTTRQARLGGTHRDHELIRGDCVPA